MTSDELRQMADSAGIDERYRQRDALRAGADAMDALDAANKRIAELEREVNRLTESESVSGMTYKCGCPALRSTNIKAFCDKHYKPLAEPGAAVSGVHCEPAEIHDQPPGSQRP